MFKKLLTKKTKVAPKVAQKVAPRVPDNYVVIGDADEIDRERFPNKEWADTGIYRVYVYVYKQPYYYRIDPTGSKVSSPRSRRLRRGRRRTKVSRRMTGLFSRTAYLLTYPRARLRSTIGRGWNGRGSAQPGSDSLPHPLRVDQEFDGSGVPEAVPPGALLADIVR